MRPFRLFPKIFMLTTFISLCPPKLWAEAPQGSASPQKADRQLIILLAAGSRAPTPENVVASAARGLHLPAGLGVGNPSAVSFAIPEIDRHISTLPELSPESPDALLLRYLVLTYPIEVDLEIVKKKLRQNPVVLHVEENSRGHLSVIPNDPLFSSTDDLGNARPPNQYQWGSYSLKLPAAWDYNKGHAYVGVVDGGVDTTHPDLQPFNAGNAPGTYGNYRSQFSYDYVYQDVDPDEGYHGVNEATKTATLAGHGTHVAGIIGATTDNRWTNLTTNPPTENPNSGVAGTCWNCSLLIMRVLDLSASAPDYGVQRLLIGRGINGAINRGAQVINLSLGFRPNQAPDCSAEAPEFLCTVLAKAHAYDVAISAASGNDHSSAIDFPANYPGVIAVGGIDAAGNFWNDCPGFECGSNFDPQQIVAPAKQILSTFYRGIFYIGSGSTCPGGATFGLCTGTSMSSPFIAGSAGVLRSVNPLLSTDNTKDLLLKHATASELPNWDFGNGRGKPDVSAAVGDALGKVGGVVLPNRLTPLFSLYSGTAGDSYYTTVPQMAAAAIMNSSYTSIGPAVPGYSGFPGVSACTVSPCVTGPGASVYIFTGDRSPFSGAPPLVPLYRLSFEGPNSVTSNPNNRDTTYTTEPAGVTAFTNVNVGYKLDGIEGYIYKRCTPEPSCIPAGAVRLYRLYNYSLDDYAIFPESELAAMQAAGYVSTPGANDWIGYVYPNVDSDGDNVIDGFERLMGTDPLRSDSDCDGLSDGTEILNYPYSDPLSSPSSCVPPTANFTVTCTDLSCSFNASSSTDNVGIVSYAWAFGDSTTGSGVTPSHAYAGRGSYTVTLVVTDTHGLTSSQTKTISVSRSKDAQVLSQSVPAVMVAGQSYTVSMTLKNVGTWSWDPVGSQCNAYRLGSLNTNWNPGMIDFAGAAAAGQTVTLNFTVTAPAAPGTYNFQWRMLQNCVEWFGDLSPNVTVTVRAAQPKDAQVLSQSVPPAMVAGQNYAVSMTLKNVGSQNWSPVGPQCNAYRLGSQNNNWNPTRAELPAAVAPGQQVTLNFTVTAPATPGTYNFQWRMVHECVEWFGDLSPNVAVTVRSAQTKDAQVLSQSVPATMVAGQSYAVSMTLKNVGSQSWSPVGPQCNAYRLGSQNNNWNPTRAELPAAVAPGQQVTLNFTVAAPVTPGTYNFQWRMVHECVEWFGDLTPNVAVTVPMDQPPGPRITYNCTGLACTFDATGSTDDHGIVSYSWTFGDSAAGTGPNPTHTYPVSGQYPVTLCVTDTTGATVCATQYAVLIFADVPPGYWARSFIEALYISGITTGCALNPRRYCPDTPITRADTAVFLITAKGSAGYTPPAATCNPLRFQDVPCTAPAAPYIEEFARRGITAGCGGGNYCPDGTVSRGTMAYFLLATLGITPPTSCTGIFSDVPCTAWYAPWVEELYRRGITGGCGGGHYCPENLTARSEAAVFVQRTFNIPLP